MPNLLGKDGAQPQKQTRFTPVYNGRFSSGLVTNRSPLRGSGARMVERYYGSSQDDLIAGSNTEVTSKLTLGRRPGSSVFDANSYTAVGRFYPFRMFGPNLEQIDVMIDQAAALYSLYQGNKSLLWTKSTGSGQSYMQSVGNSLYWGDGVDNKKWLQTLNQWTATTQLNGTLTPVMGTFLIDSNGYIQQYTGTVFPVTEIAVAGNVLTITSSANLTDNGIVAGSVIHFPATMAASFLEGKTVTVLSNPDHFNVTAAFVHVNYGPAAETNVSATEISGLSTPTTGGTVPGWNTVVPSAQNNFQGGLTNDGTVQWTNRGSPVENWGIANTTKASVPVIGATTVAWRASTYFSLSGVVIDPNGNLQQVAVAGKSGTIVPQWATTVGSTTNDGTAAWKMIQTAASLTWHANTPYVPSTSLALTAVATGSGGTTVYTGSIAGGASNALAGKNFIVSGFSNAPNNGTFICTASTLTTITMQNGAGVAETNNAVALTEGQYLVGSAYGTNCLFQLAPLQQPTINGSVSAYLYPTSHSGAVGAFTQVNPVSTSSALASDTSLNSLSFFGQPRGEGADLTWNIINGSGTITGTVQPFMAQEPLSQYDYNLIILTSFNVPQPGQYTFTIKHQDGMFWGIGNGAVLVSGPSASANVIGQTITAAEGYPSFGGTNGTGGSYTDTYTVNFPTAGVYPVEVDYHYWYHSGQIFNIQCNGFPMANGTAASGSNVPVWPSWSTSYAPSYPSVTETNGQLTWLNLGPATDFTWAVATNFTLPDTTIIDPNGNTEAPYRTGVTGVQTPSFLTGLHNLTADNPNLIWINQGAASTTPTGTVSTYNGGWQYCVALVNTLDNTVSNCSNLSASTGNFIGADGVILAPGAGLPPVDQIDPQSDYVAIFRTTDGLSTPFLIPGTYTTYTLPLSQYLTSGYTDLTLDTGLNNLISGAINGENTPPAPGAQNLAFHLNRIFYSIGNTVFWTAGANTPVGNGVNGTPPLNFDNFPSLVKRIVPTTTGAIIFTVSDVYVIQGSGTASNPIQTGIPLLQGVGLLSYNALDVNGSIIGFFTTDNQFCILDPSSGVSYAGFPIGDQLRMANGNPGQNWNPASVYVTWYVNGEDQGWFLSDGSAGWYRLIPTPSPEQGYTWSPFASIVGGCKAVQSVEVQPGMHKLLLGPTGTGPILNRDLSSSTDNGQTYPANAVVGSIVLAQPGQVATVSFIATESVRTGTPLTIGLLLDDALPYYNGPFDILKVWENDPPGLTPSRSFYAQRFYLNETKDEAVCRHLQIKFQWAAEDAANEIETFTVFGAYMQEQ